MPPGYGAVRRFAPPYRSLTRRRNYTNINYSIQAIKFYSEISWAKEFYIRLRQEWIFFYISYQELITLFSPALIDKQYGISQHVLTLTDDPSLFCEKKIEKITELLHNKASPYFN